MFIQDFLVHTNEYYGITPTQEVNLTAPVLVQAQVEGNRGILMPWWAFLQWVSWRKCIQQILFQEKLFRDMLSIYFCQSTRGWFLGTASLVSFHQGLDSTISR